jgi:hypothetical protein
LTVEDVLGLEVGEFHGQSGLVACSHPCPDQCQCQGSVR